MADLRTAADRLQQALDRPEDEFLRDACIQRFEFSFELSWKGVQALARLHDQECPSPRARPLRSLRVRPGAIRPFSTHTHPSRSRSGRRR
ncbi:MAG: nucleotidyltransferase substrate binding protein [Deltaproteobacteria bacterium]|nr:nucleotidyltransferase substrate binding protein [Deltaproteobacteria bacterium]